MRLLPFRTVKARAYSRGHDGIQVREPGETFVIREYSDDPDRSGWYDIIGDATAEETEDHTRQIGNPGLMVPDVLPPDGPKTGTYQHEHKGGGWWTGRHDRQTPSTNAREPISYSQIPQPKAGDVDPNSL